MNTINVNGQFIYMEREDDLREKIRVCEQLEHAQQVAYSTHWDRLTQVCFTCQKVRTTVPNKIFDKDK